MGNFFASLFGATQDESTEAAKSNVSQVRNPIKEIFNDANEVIGLSVPCTFVKYNIGDNVIIKFKNGAMVEMKIEKIASDPLKPLDYFIGPDGVEIKFDLIQQKVPEKVSEIKQNGGDWGIGYIGTTNNGPSYFYNNCHPGIYLINDVVKYVDIYDNKYILKILNIDTTKKMVILGDEKENVLDSIPYANLREKLEPDAELKIPDLYRINSPVKFYNQEGQIINGTIKGILTLSNPETGEKKYEITVLPKGETEWFKEIKIKPSQIVQNPGKQKYTLEEDSKYRVKYMKYKAKYLSQKNN